METLPEPGQSPLLIHFPGCSKCRSIDAILRERGVAFRERLYREQPLDADELRALIQRLDAPAAELVRTKDAAAAGLEPAPDAPEAELVALLTAHPELLQRPVLVVGTRAAIGRPNELALALLGTD